jgi:hypothetical protein
LSRSSRTGLASAWRKASSSTGQGNCVEVGTGEAIVAVRDSKNMAGPELEFTGRHGQISCRGSGTARLIADP